MYSELYPILLKIYHGPEGDLDMLVSNLENLRSFVGEDYKQAEGKRAYSPYLYGRILKLSDHINLEYQRLMESDEVRKEISRMSTERRKLENKTRKAMKKAKNLQLEVISILAISHGSRSSPLHELSPAVAKAASSTAPQRHLLLFSSFIMVCSFCLAVAPACP